MARDTLINSAAPAGKLASALAAAEKLRQAEFPAVPSEVFAAGLLRFAMRFDAEDLTSHFLAEFVGRQDMRVTTNRKDRTN
jgi:hypothetical protein